MTLEREIAALKAENADLRAQIGASRAAPLRSATLNSAGGANNPWARNLLERLWLGKE